MTRLPQEQPRRTRREALPKWLDGPTLVAWLEACGLRQAIKETSEKGRSALRRWECGGVASVYTLDRLLTEAGVPTPSIIFELDEGGPVFTSTEAVPIPGGIWRDPPAYCQTEQGMVA